MTSYVLRRLSSAALILLVVCVATFVVFFLLPADPAVNACGRACTPERIALIRHQMGLDRPLLRQFTDYVVGIFAGREYGTGPATVHCPFPCLGFSFQNNLPVWQLITDRLPVTASIAVGAAVLWLSIGVTTGVVSALRRGSAWDRGAMLATLGGVSLPVYFTALALLYVVVIRLGVLDFPRYVPLTESPLRWAANLALPWLTLAILHAALYARLTRAGMLEVMGEDFIRTARAKGLPESRVVVRHGLRAGLAPIVTVFGLDLGGLLGGAVITETVYGLPGLGQLDLQAVARADQPVILGVTLTAAVFIVAANLIVDLLYALLDPRVRCS